MAGNPPPCCQGRSPAGLLSTYSAERRAQTIELIDFDREWAAMLSNHTSNDAAMVKNFLSAMAATWQTLRRNTNLRC